MYKRQLQDAHGDGLVQQIDDGTAHGAHGDGHTDGQQLAQDGVFIVVIALEKGSSQVAAGPDIVSRGFVYVRDSEELMSGARSRIENVLERCNTGNVTEWNAIKTQIRDALGRYFFEKTKRRPMILPIIQEVR